MSIIIKNFTLQTLSLLNNTLNKYLTLFQCEDCLTGSWYLMFIDFMMNYWRRFSISTRSICAVGRNTWIRFRYIFYFIFIVNFNKNIIFRKYELVEVTSSWSFIGSMKFFSNGESNSFIPCDFYFGLVNTIFNAWSSVSLQPNIPNQQIESSSVSIYKIGIHLKYFLRYPVQY